MEVVFTEAKFIEQVIFPMNRLLLKQTEEQSTGEVQYKRNMRNRNKRRLRDINARCDVSGIGLSDLEFSALT